MSALNGSSVLRLSEALNDFLNTKFKFCVRVLGGFFWLVGVFVWLWFFVHGWWCFGVCFGVLFVPFLIFILFCGFLCLAGVSVMDRKFSSTIAQVKCHPDLLCLSFAVACSQRALFLHHY